ncbi:MAG TPA: hypothetical protein VFZ66_27540 [Herpetosiphonaceae bacterium]
MRGLVFVGVLLILGGLVVMAQPEMPSWDKVSAARTLISRASTSLPSMASQPTTEWVRADVVTVEPHPDGTTVTVRFDHPDGFRERATAAQALGVRVDTVVCFELSTATRRDDPAVRTIERLDPNILRCAR